MPDELILEGLAALSDLPAPLETGGQGAGWKVPKTTLGAALGDLI